MQQFHVFLISLHSMFLLDLAILRRSRTKTMSTYVKITVKTYILRHYIGIKIFRFFKIKHTLHQYSALVYKFLLLF
jgi:hypothetical protein